MGKLKRLAGDTVLYGLGSILPKFLNFLLVLLHTDVFLPAEYGIITNLYAYVTFINVLFTFGMETAYFRFASKPGADEKKIFNLTQTVVVSISLILSLIIIGFAQPIAIQLDIESQSNYVIWIVAILFIDSVVAIPFARLRLQNRPLKFAFGRILNILILVGLNVYFLIYAYDQSIGVAYVFIANLTANVFYLFFFSKTLIQWRPAYEKETSSAMFSYAYPIMVTGLAGMTNETFSRLTLQWWLPENFYEGKTSEYALGIFGACYKFSVIMSLVIQAFRYAAEPFFFANAADKNSPQLFAKVNHYFVIVCCVILLGVSTNLDLLKHILRRPEYWEGLGIVPILLLGYLFLGIYYNMSVWFKLIDKTYYGTIITVGGAIITFLANYMLIPYFGYIGSSWATFICYFSMTVVCYFLGQKYYPIPYRIVKDAGYILIASFLVYATNQIILENQWLATGFHIVILASFVLFAYLLERKELNLLPFRK
ncbi:MAG TPA: polysaccharide biosynthesis C-terminal domain-containing protein [Chryseolinea sp.]|nr:polysaccharide biosynthesis C-terminal domain-containing protein [Chryseolinea sp.]